MKKIIIIIAAILLVCFMASIAFANYGTRPMAMGGAFTAIADDANAAYYNPAGFAINPGVELKGTMLLDHRNELIGDNFAALKMGFETRMASPFHWILGVGALTAAGLTAAQYLSERDILKKNWGRSGEKTKKTASMSEEVKKEDQGEKKSRKQIIGTGLSQLFGGDKKKPTSTKKVVTEKYVYHHGPIYNPVYHPYLRHPTYYENREYANDPNLTPTNKAQFALGLTYLRDNNATLDQNTNWYALSLATAWEETIALGTNVNVYDLTIPSTNAKGLGGGLDFGILIRSYERLFLGLYAQEVLTTDIQWTNGVTTRYEMKVNAGAALKPIPEITVAVDMHNIFNQNRETSTMHYGVELIPFPGVALRGGLYDGNKTVGAGLKLGEIMLDYAMLGGSYSRTQMSSLTWKF